MALYPSILGMDFSNSSKPDWSTNLDENWSKLICISLSVVCTFVVTPLYSVYTFSHSLQIQILVNFSE